MSIASGEYRNERCLASVDGSAVAERRSDVELLHDLSVELIGERDVATLYQKIMDAAVAIMLSQYASMQLLSPERDTTGSAGELHLLAFRGFNPEAAKFWEWVRADSDSTCGMALRTGKRSVVTDVETCDFMAGSDDLATYRQTGIRSVQTTPLVARDGKIMGMISTHWSEPHQPSERDFKLMDILARQAADLLERTKAEDELRTSERQLAGILGSITDAFMSFDSEFQFTFANEQFVRRVGKSSSELVGLNLWELFPAAVGNVAHRELIRAMTDRVAVDYELFYEPWQRWFSDKAYPTVDGGLAVYSQDISERKRSELLGLEQTRLLELIASGAPADACLTALTDAIPRLRPTVRAGVLTANLERDAMGRVFAAHLAPAFGRGIEGLSINETPIGTCSTAIFEGKPVACADIAHDERFSQTWREHCLAHGIKACRSTPVPGTDGKALASFVMLFSEPHEADAWELKIAEFGAHVVAIVLERDGTAAALKQAEESADRRNKQRDLLARISEELLLSAELNADGLHRIFEATSDVVGLELFFHFEVQDQPRNLRLIASRGLTKEQRDYFATIRFGEYLCGTVAERREPRVVEDLQNCEYAEAAALRASGVKCYAGFPLVAHGRLIGTIAFATRTRERFRDGELQLIQGVCDLVAAALERFRLFKELRQSEERFRAITDYIPQLTWMAEPGTEGQATWFNKAWLDYTGTTMEQNQGSGWHAVHHPDHAPRVIPNFERHVSEGLDWEDTFPLRAKDGSFRWFLSRMNVIRDESGKPARIFGTNTDVTELRHAQEMQQMLTGELSHRVKNMLATVQSIATQTLRHNKNPAEFVTSFSGRIQSMSRVHSQLSGGDWQGANLRDVIRDQVLLGPVDETRVTAWGPDVSLEAQTVPLVAMMLHELGTNSIKYGALSKPDGVVTVSWTVSDDLLQLHWAERGGPPLSAPAKRGFGTALIEQSAKSAGGSARMSIEADGVRWEITLRVPRAAKNSLQQSKTEFVEAVTPRSPLASSNTTSPLLAGKRFLVVEDEPLLALDVVMILEDAGVEIAGSVGNATDALNLIDNTRLDAALLDANLGGLPVDEIASALTRQNVPFVFVTGYGRQSLPRAFATAPMLSKPVSGQQLLEAAATLVRKPADVRKLRS